MNLDDLVTRRFSLEETDLAFRELDAGRIVGRSIVELGADPS